MNEIQYKDIFRDPETIQNLKGKSAQARERMLGNDNLMQIMRRSATLISQLMQDEAPYKEQLEQLAVRMVKKMYPVIDEFGIEIEWNLWRNQITLFPFTPARNVSISALTMNTTFSAGTPGTPQIVMCAYDHNITTNQPGNLILSSSTITLEFPFVQHQYNTNYTFSAGTTYWMGYAFNDMDAVTAGFCMHYKEKYRFYQEQMMMVNHIY